ncbi:MAG: hypothetical protein EBT15_00095 [Betaproteobacteria bacterium]|nr:hypothetical protein [Betaproteobacteria bacterium]
MEKSSHRLEDTLMNLLLAALLLFPLALHAQERTDRFELEAGVVSTRNMEIRGYNQSNATDGWSKSSPTARFEYWRVKDNSWNYGLVFQPLSQRYQDTLKSNLSAKGKTFTAGSSATLDYQFPTIRFSANTPISQGDDGGYVRAGGSLVVRYAKVGLSTASQSFNDTNWIAVPLVNIEANRSLGGAYSLFTRADFLPGFDGNVFLDGLYDVFFGVRRKVDSTSNLDVGIRLFFGGYDPKKADDYANRIFFNSLVVRYTF